MDSPSAQKAIKILSNLQEESNPSWLAYWVTPNTILTLSGARAFCDGVFYSRPLRLLAKQEKEIRASIEIIKSITDIKYTSVGTRTNPLGEKYVFYDVVLTDGIKYSINNSKLIKNSALELLGQNYEPIKFTESLPKYFVTNKKLADFNKESLNHAALGILLGYPDKAILGSVGEWDKDDPFGEPLIEADIRGAGYYSCPMPIYSYPRHLVNDEPINDHEKLWSKILKDFYSSEFHQKLSKNKQFKLKIKELNMIRASIS